MLFNFQLFFDFFVKLSAGYLIYAVVWYAYYLPRNSIITRRKRDKKAASTMRKQIKSVSLAAITALVLSGISLLKIPQIEVFIAVFLFLFIPMLLGIFKGYTMPQSDVEALNHSHLYFTSKSN